MDDIEDTNYKFNSQDIENIWYIFFCLADSTFSSVDVSYGKEMPTRMRILYYGSVGMI